MKPGDRIELVYTDDRFTDLQPGDRGTVNHVNQASMCTQISVDWDNGSKLMMVPESGDRIRKVASL